MIIVSVVAIAFKVAFVIALSFARVCAASVADFSRFKLLRKHVCGPKL